MCDGGISIKYVNIAQEEIDAWNKICSEFRTVAIDQKGDEKESTLKKVADFESFIKDHEEVYRNIEIARVSSWTGEECTDTWNCIRIPEWIAIEVAKKILEGKREDFYTRGAGIYFE